MKIFLFEKYLFDFFEEWVGVSLELMLFFVFFGLVCIYYCLQYDGKSVIGIYSFNWQENEVFVGFFCYFYVKGLLVLEIYVEQLDNNVYLQEDFGVMILYSYLLQCDDGFFFNYLMIIYKWVVEDLAWVQIRGGQGLDYSKCFFCVVFD